MSVKLKLQRKGTKNQPKYRLVVQEAKAKLSGGVIEILGEYEPLKSPCYINFDKDKVLKWLKNGAQPTEKVRILLGKSGILPPVNTSILTQKKPKKGEAAATAEAKQGEAK